MIDTNILTRRGLGRDVVNVLAQRHEVMFRDGRAVILHPLYAHDMPLLTGRALRLQDATGARLLWIDLDRVLPGLDAELRATPANDCTGLVFYRLRFAFKTAEAFVRAAEAIAIGTWHAVADGWVWEDEARMVQAELFTPPAALPSHQPQQVHA